MLSLKTKLHQCIATFEVGIRLRVDKIRKSIPAASCYAGTRPAR